MMLNGASPDDCGSGRVPRPGKEVVERDRSDGLGVESDHGGAVRPVVRQGLDGRGIHDQDPRSAVGDQAFERARAGFVRHRHHARSGRDAAEKQHDVSQRRCRDDRNAVAGHDAMARKGGRRLLGRRGEARPVKPAFTAGERRCPRPRRGMPADGRHERRGAHGARSSMIRMMPRATSAGSSLPSSSISLSRVSRVPSSAGRASTSVWASRTRASQATGRTNRTRS